MNYSPTARALSMQQVKLSRVSFSEFNAARRAIARTLDLLDADALEFSVDGPSQIVRWQPGAGSI